MKTRREFLSQSAMLATGALQSTSPGMASPAQPDIHFPARARDRIAVASYPFRDFILPAEYVSTAASPPAPKMELTEFAAHIKSRFSVNKIEPWSYEICHVKQSEATEKGANVQVDLAYVFAVLKKTGFRGYLSMEYDNTGDPCQETEELIRKTPAFVS
jgi:hypothetical protein